MNIIPVFNDTEEIYNETSSSNQPKIFNKEFIIELFYYHFKNVFNNKQIYPKDEDSCGLRYFIDYYKDDDNIYFDLKKRYIVLYHKGRYINIPYDYIIKNNNHIDTVIKNILFEKYINCNICMNKLYGGTCFVTDNDVICNKCYCTCHTTEIKYKIKNKEICFHCLEKILDIDFS